MQYGEKISTLRKLRGMTQSELGDALNVTYQAVSKWERDESVPDFETLSKLAKIFNIEIAYFESDVAITEDAILAHTLNKEKDAGPAMIGVCTVCGKLLHEGENEEGEEKLICKPCAEVERKKLEEAKKRAEQTAEAERHKKLAMQAAQKSRFTKRSVIASIIAGIIALAVLALFIASMIKSSESVGGAVIAVAVIIPIMLFTWIFQLFWDGAVREVNCWGLAAIRLPGIIFTADLDGLIFLIVTKLFLTVLSWLISLVLIVLTSILAMFVSVVTFIPVIVKIHNCNEDIL